ncbi:MAG TPA: carbon-nitrogen hydrolase family protein [Polyangiaceae bacterium]|nr:carbon-nitrogen hydrolase family protein [Polyangiaceae bacterium]
MRVAVVQLNSQADVAKNLAQVEALVGRAVEQGAELVTLPENFAFMGERDEDKRAVAEELSGDGPIIRTLARLARERGIFLLGGGMPEKSADPDRPYNSSVLLAPNGALLASYRKVHLFDVDLPDGTQLRESAGCTPGEETCVVAVRERMIGMTICYDVRFPELYRRLADAGALVVTVPAAFTLTTGKDHWHVLLRARAIENQVFVLAPAQTGKHPRGRQTYGKSLIVDPWGDVLAQCGEGEGVAVATLDFDYQKRVRAALPSLAHRVGLFDQAPAALPKRHR